MIKIGCALVLSVFRYRRSAFVWGMVIGLIFSGCAGKQPVPGRADISPEAEKLLERLSGQNVTPIRFKGYGKYRLELPDGKFSGRMAWAVIQPDLFRAEILDVTGRPFTTIASDGQWVYAYFKAEHQFYKKPSAQATFTRVMGAPVTVKDIIGFLSGRIPIHPHQKAQVRPSEKALILVLRGKWNRLVEEVYFDRDTLVPVRIVMYSRAGVFSYQVDIGGQIHRESYSFFRDLSFQNSRHHGFRITLDRVWPNVELAPSVFKLRDPHSE